MKKYLYFSLAAVAFASCTSDEFVGEGPGQGNVANVSKAEEAIAFGSGTANPTRAEVGGSAAAEKLNKNFIVYGFKTNATEAADASTDQMVFNLYNVNYEAGTANTTESNTANWEYVGYANHTGSVNPQTIKYWDHSANSYVFSAVSGTGITATKTESVTSPATIYDKGWTVTIPAGGDLSTLYASDRLPVAPSAFNQQVTLKFRSLGTKIRFAMYETIPGYSVKIDRFYYKESTAADASWKNTSTNFAIDGTFKTANADKVTPLTIKYYDAPASIENRPKVIFADGDVTSSVYGTFGANIQAAQAIGTTSAEATYDQSDKSYTIILPYENASNNLELYVDYTLTSTDGSNEKIKVWHASAKVPSNFAQWKPNFAYTYIFKISDNTNGSTATPDTDPSGPFKEEDPTTKPTDPEKVGLFPITFDAVVITDEEDVQETITSVANPSITTYQKGIVATTHNEYVADDDIYFEDGGADVSNFVVYEVNNYGKETTTEEVVANWKNNFCVLTKVDVEYADGTTNDGNFIPLSNGTFIKKAANQAAKFTPAAGKTYVIANNVAGSATQFKVVKVEGTPTAPTYEQKMTTKVIGAANGSAVFRLRSNSPKANLNVLGAASLLKIYDSSDNDVTTNFTIVPGASAGNYKIALTPAAIAAGANGTYTVKFNGDGDQTFEVALSYELTSSPVTVVVDGTTATFTLTDGTNAISKAVIKNLPEGVTITETATAGTYEVAATAAATAGEYTTTTVAGQALTINVDTYAFIDSRTFTLDYEGNALQQTLYLTKNVTDYADVAVAAMADIDESVAKIIKAGAGIYAVVPMGPGSYTVKYENASADITVYQYTIATPASIKKSTGIANIEVKCNGETINAATASLVETFKPDDVLYADVDEYNTAKSTSLDATAFAALPYTAKVKTAGSVYTVSTNGKTIKFSNASKAGDYKFNYVVGDVIVAQVTVTVTD